MANEPNTPAAADEISTDLKTIAPLQNEDVPLDPVPEPAAPPAPATKTEPDTPPVDPRAARLEEIASRRRDAVSTELEQIAEATVPAPSPEPETRTEPAPTEPTAGDPTRKVRLKVRGEIIEMTEPEALALAQKTAAADSYLSEARSTLDEVKELRRTAGQPAAPTPATAAPAATTEPEAPVDRLALYSEAIQNGVDPAEARKLLDDEISDRINQTLEQRTAAMTEQQVLRAFDSEVATGFAKIADDHPDMAKDSLAADLVFLTSQRVEAGVISRYLSDGADETTRRAFAAVGITPESVARYSPEDAHKLFRDMHRQGYPLPKPAAIIGVAGKLVAEKWAATTRTPAPVTAPDPNANPTPAPVAVNRTGRKEAISQPERTAIPRTPTAQPAPRTEAERAAQARQEARDERRKGIARG